MRRLMGRCATLLILVALAACGPARELAGEYDVITLLRPQSQQHITLDVLIDFNCPPCRRFHPELQQLEEKYGERLSITLHPLNNPRSTFAVRLYAAAVASGQGESVVQAFYAAAEKKWPLSTEDEVRRAVAELSLVESVWELARSERVLPALEADYQFALAVKPVTPTILVQQQLRTEPHRANLETLIDGLLAPSTL
jgi:thiol-disulfide isomerase/thioredoxin